MKPVVAVPAAVGVGYVLGRTHKLRLAMVLVAAAAGGKFADSISKTVQQGFSSLTESGGLQQLTAPGGQMLDAAKGAAVAALSSRLDSFTHRLTERPDGGQAGEYEEPAEEEGEYEEPEAEHRRRQRPSAPRGRGQAERPPSREPARSRANEPEQEEEEEEDYDSDYEDENEMADEEPESRSQPERRERGRAPVRRTR